MSIIPIDKRLRVMYFCPVKLSIENQKLNMDTIDEKAKQEILRDAKILDYNLKLLIEQCDSWLPEEEGRRNVQIRWNEREKARRKMRRRKFMNAVFKLFRMKKRYPIDHSVFYAWYE